MNAVHRLFSKYAVRSVKELTTLRGRLKHNPENSASNRWGFLHPAIYYPDVAKTDKRTPSDAQVYDIFSVSETHERMKGVLLDTHKLQERETLTAMINNGTSYIRAVNDYTISCHELYSSKYGSAPMYSHIVEVKNIPSANHEKILSVLRCHFDKIGFGRDLFSKSSLSEDNDDEEDGNGYSVLHQYNILHSNAGKNVGLELLVSENSSFVTVMGSDESVVDEVATLIKDARKDLSIEKVRKERTFCTISAGNHGFFLEDLTLKNDHLEDIVYHNYNDDFEECDQVIKNAIATDSKGLILLHGIPGSGKTSYIKHLITGTTKRKLVYIPTHLASSLASPNFISFVKSELVNSVLVIEDAEQVLMSRESAESHKDAVANLLNITDGILGDALNILVICTFNTDVQNLDSALLRKGRLVIQYSFGLLTKDKTNALCQKLYGKTVDKELSLAEIYGLEYNLIRPREVPKIKMGFVK